MATNISIGVVGTGTMGKGIVQMLAQADNISCIVWKGNSVERAQLALSNLGVLWNKLVSKNIFEADTVEKFLQKRSITHSYDDFSNVQCLIEAVPEQISSKKDVFLNLNTVLAKNTILATTTSSLSITELSCFFENPSNVIGLHFFNPAPIMQLTEVISGLLTSQETIDWTMAFAANLGKSPVLVNEAPGFIVNRMLIPMINEAIGILAEGVACAEEIDRAMCLGANHPIGPLALADLIGNDVNLSIMETLYSETGDPKYRAHPLLRKMVRANRLGRKTKHGFFMY